MTVLERIRIEKAAADCGFERQVIQLPSGALELCSATFPEKVYVTHDFGAGYRVTASEPSLLQTQSQTGEVIVSCVQHLYEVLQHAAAMARTMPNRVADAFKAQVRNLPQTTEAERLVVQRVGQNIFREALLDFWQGHCCVTGLAVPSLLRASHIKPWAACETDEERLDVFNGLLLAPHLDALFDGGWITFSNSGKLIFSAEFSNEAKKQLCVLNDFKISGLASFHLKYLQYHQNFVFKRH